MATIEYVNYTGTAIQSVSALSCNTAFLPQSTLQVFGTTSLGNGQTLINGSLLFPDIGMTTSPQTIGGVTYTATMSSDWTGSTWWPYSQNFANQITTSTYTGAGSSYVGSSSTTDAGTSTAYSGAWVQLQSSTAFAIPYYGLTTRNPETSFGPASFRLFGSNDGTNWYTINAQSGQTYTVPYVMNYFSTLNEIKYTYFRLVVLTAVAPNTCRVVGLQYYAFNPNTDALTVIGGTVKFSSNVTAQGNVFVSQSLGIGTTAPTANLHVVGNIYASNAVTTTNVYLISGVTNSTAGQIVKGALEFNGTSNVFYGTSSTIRGLIPVQYFYQLNADTALGTTTSAALVPAFPGMVNGVQLQNGKYYVKMIHVLTITTSATAGNTQLNMVFASATGTATASMATGGVWSQNVTSTTAIGATASAQTVNTIFFNSSSATERISAITTAVSTATNYYTTFEGTFAISAPGGYFPNVSVTSPGTFTATPGVRRGSYIYLQKIGDNAVDVNIGGWS